MREGHSQPTQPTEGERRAEEIRRKNELIDLAWSSTPASEGGPRGVEAKTEKKNEWEPQEPNKEAWLRKLADFIVIANTKTWAADGAEVNPQRPGYKELQWPYAEDKMSEQDKKDYKGWEDWSLRDSFTGYFRAPGMTTVYYKGKPAWTMSYGGHGQTEGYEGQAKQTFNFLKSALMRVTSDLPIRGPKEYIEGDKKYEFEMIEGNIEDGLWKEKITEDGVVTFRQTGLIQISINKDANRKPQLPWNF